MNLMDGSKVDMDTYYSVVTNDFMATGGDSFNFAGAKNIFDTGVPIREALVEELRNLTAAGKILSVTPAEYLIPYVAVTGIALDKSYLTIKPGETANLTAIVTPSNAINKNITWKSSNTSIATVDENGKVTGKSIGSVVITATTEEGNYSAAAYAAVAKVPANSVTLNRKSVIITKNDTVKLVANINPGDASVKDMIWTINTAELGNLVVDGKTAILKNLKPGTIKVTVTTLDGGHTDECTVIVVSSASEISKVLKLQSMLNAEF
jgi:uncharacterized protein YjdB